MAFLSINRITIEGNSNIVIQDANGNVEAVAISQLVNEIMLEKDKRIAALEDLANARMQLGHLQRKEIERQTIQLREILKDKLTLESYVRYLLGQISAKDISATSKAFKKALGLFLYGNIGEASMAIHGVNLEEEKAWLLAQEENLQQQRLHLAESYFFRAQLDCLAGDLPTAIINIQEAIRLVPALPSFQSHLGFFYFLDKQYQLAVDTLLEANKMLELMGDAGFIEIAYNYHCLGKSYGGLYDFQNALKAYTRILYISKEKKQDEDDFILSLTYTDLATICTDLMLREDVLFYSKKSLETALSGGFSKEIIATFSNNLGAAYFFMEDYTNALIFIKNSINLNNEIGKDIEGCQYFNKGITLFNLGDEQQGLQLMLKAIDVDLKLYGDQCAQLLKYYIELGQLYITKNEYSKAEPYLLAALEIGKLIDGVQSPPVAMIFYSLGVMQQGSGRYLESIDFFRNAVSIRQSLFGDDDKTLGKWFIHMSTSYGHLRQLKEQLSALQRGYKILGEMFQPENGVSKEFVEDCIKAVTNRIEHENESNSVSN